MAALDDLILEADALKIRLAALRETLDNEAIREALRIEFTFESNRIEGNTLTMRETQMVIQNGLTVGGKSLREHLEAINHGQAVQFIEAVVAEKTPISESLLKQLHGLILHGIDRENAGIYRRVPVLIAGSSHLPPQPWQLDSLMHDYFLFYETQKNSLHPILLAAEMHERLVWIHPFIDGNGRTSRLVMNLILLQHGFPLAIIGGDFDSRMRYYHALEQPEKIAFLTLIAERVVASLKRYLEIFGETV